jgi:hypothetical protein
MESIKPPNNSKFTLDETSGQARGSGEQFHHVMLQSGQSKEVQQPDEFKTSGENPVTRVSDDHMMRAPRVP